MTATAATDPPSLRITSPAALESLALGGATDEPYLLVDLREDTLDPKHTAWLARQPVPLLALAAPDAQGDVIWPYDVVAPDPDMLLSAIRNIEQAPLAASVLVQTLRVTATMPLRDALVVESLAFAALQAGPEFAHWKATRNKTVKPAQENGAPVLLERKHDVLDITLNRPGNRNAISVEMRDALTEAFELAAADTTIASLTLRGAGACFSVGGDLHEFGLATSPAEAHMIRMRRLPALALLPVADRMTSYLHGACIGAGIELPAFAGRVSAKADTFFQLPELRFGLIPGAGGCVSIPRRIGRQKMAYFALSSRRISATTALAWRLIDEITP